jgi:hypothetical protein
VLCPVDPPRPGLRRPLFSSCRAPPNERSSQPAPVPALPACWQRADSVLFASVSLVFRLYSASIPLWFPWVCPAPAPPQSHPAFRRARTTALHYRDAAAPEKVTALLRREFPSQSLKAAARPSRPRTYQRGQDARRDRRPACPTTLQRGWARPVTKRGAFSTWRERRAGVEGLHV